VLFLRSRSLFFLLALVCSFASATAHALTGGDTVSGVILLPEQSDSYSFYASAGDGYVINAGPTGGTDFLPVFRVYAPDGSEQGVSNYGRTAYQGSAPQSGTYTIVVYDYFQDHTGSYNLSFAKANGSTITMVAELLTNADNTAPTPIRASRVRRGERRMASG